MLVRIPNKIGDSETLLLCVVKYQQCYGDRLCIHFNDVNDLDQLNTKKTGDRKNELICWQIND